MQTQFTIPPAPSEPLLVGLSNQISVPWYRFFLGLFQTVGSGTAPIPIAQMITNFVSQSIAVVVPSWLRVSGSPISGSAGLNGTFIITSAVIQPNEVLAGPDGSAGILLPRRLVGADLPTPTTISLGGVKSIAPTAHQFLTSIDATGQPAEAQPAFADISGAIAGAQTTAGVATNSNAHIGYPGEFISSSVAAGSAVGLTTVTPATVTSILLTPGDWDVYGSIYFTPAGGTIIASEAGGMNTVAATLPTAPNGGYVEMPVTLPAGTESALALGYMRQSLVGPSRIYLVARASFSVSTCGAYGVISARRSANVY